MNWNGKPVLVTGGASFIGSHLVDALLERGVVIRVVDDLSSGRMENIRGHVDAGRVEFFHGDLLQAGVAQKAVDGIEVVFHLAAIHGGRGYVDTHQAECAGNLALDGVLFLACREAGVEQIVFASSGCVYPNYLQTDPAEVLFLSEEMTGPPYDADNIYGWAKLMGEMTLRYFHQKWGIKTASCRYFTVYGERGIENHAVMAMIARAFIRQDPFEIWGTGQQVRNWTYVGDIVEGTILAAERIHDGTAVNLGTNERIRVVDAARQILDYTGHRGDFRYLPDMPVGPQNRVADNRLAKRLLDWEPRVKFSDGLRRTVDWYFSNRKAEEVQENFEHKLMER